MNQQTAIVSKKLLDRATQVQKLITHLWASFKRKPMALGIAIAKAKAQNIWSVLGFESENAWRESLDIGRSTWFRSGRVAELCMKGHVPEKELLKMTVDNAEILLDLPGKQLKQPKWWKLAQEKKAHELAELVAQALPAGKDGEAAAPVVESRVKWTVHMYEGQKKVIAEAMREFARENSIPLDDEGRILELICAQVHGDRQSLVRAVRTVVLPQMRRALEAYKTNGKSADEQLDLFVDVMQKAAEALKQVVVQ